VPVFPWRFIDSLLGRSRPGDEEAASADDVSAEVTRLAERIEADISATERLNEASKEALRSWAGGMLRRRAPEPDGRSRRDINVQLGAVGGAIRVVIQTIDEAMAKSDDATGQALARRLRPLESEIGPPLYSLDEQALARRRLDRVLEQVEESEAPLDPAAVIPRIIQALTPTES
jgi:hypothetical protein